MANALVPRLRLNAIRLAQTVEFQPPYTFKYVGDVHKVDQVEKALDDLEKTEGFERAADEFFNDFEQLTRSQLPNKQKAIEMVSLFCEAYPQFGLQDFDLLDSKNQQDKIEMVGSQQSFL